MRDHLKTLAAIVAARPAFTLITFAPEGYARARTVSRLNDLSEGYLDFATGRKEKKTGEIAADPRVTLFFVDPETRDHASVYGKAKLVDDPAVKALRWREEFRRYWPGGSEDPDFIVIRVEPVRGEYLLAEPEITGEVRFGRKD